MTTTKALAAIALPYVTRRKAEVAEWQSMSREERGFYCVHGTYVGDPYGADYICGYCEDGDYNGLQFVYAAALDYARGVLAKRERVMEALTILRTENVIGWEEAMDIWNTLSAG